MMSGIREMSQVYIDALVADQDKNIVFLSAWGLDTAVQEFLARITLAYDEGGMTSLTLLDGEGEPRYRFGATSRLEKYTGRINQASLFSNLVQVWLYDRLAAQPDRANRQAILLKSDAEPDEAFSQRLWQAVQGLCPVPLLPEWQSLLVEFRQQGWVQSYPGIQVSATMLDFSSEQVEHWMSQHIQAGYLKCPKKGVNLTVVK